MIVIDRYERLLMQATYIDHFPDKLIDKIKRHVYTLSNYTAFTLIAPLGRSIKEFVL